MFTLISYDITDDKRRTKLMKLLEGYGERVQYSVFEAELTPLQLATLQRDVRTLIDANTDSVRYYFLDVAAKRRIQIMGLGKVTTDEPFILV